MNIRNVLVIQDIITMVLKENAISVIHYALPAQVAIIQHAMVVYLILE